MSVPDAGRRGLWTAAGFSMAWHLFWMFGITVSVEPRFVPRLRDFQLYFVGPVLTDEAFNTLIMSRPEMSATYYRGPAPLPKMLEPLPESLGRRSPGELVSLPSSQTAWRAVRGILERESPYPESEFADRFVVEVFRCPYPVTGGLKDRGILSLPKTPRELDDRMPGQSVLPAAEFEIAVDASGKVSLAENVVSSGDAELDLALREYLKKWQFMPVEESPDQPLVRGRVRFKPSGKRV